MENATQRNLMAAKKKIEELEARCFAIAAMFRNELKRNEKLNLELSKIKRPGWLRRLLGF